MCQQPARAREGCVDEASGVADGLASCEVVGKHWSISVHAGIHCIQGPQSDLLTLCCGVIPGGMLAVASEWCRQIAIGPPEATFGGPVQVILESKN